MLDIYMTLDLLITIISPDHLLLRCPHFQPQNVHLGSQHILLDILFSVTSSECFQFSLGVVTRVDPDTSSTASERDILHSTFDTIQKRYTLYFIQG